MLKLLLASLLAVGCSAPAEAHPVQRPHVEAQIVFAIDHKLKIEMKRPAWRFEVRTDGAWRYIETQNGRSVTLRRGRLARGDLQQIARLTRAPWNVSRAQVTCMAYAAEYTEYRVDGDLVWHDEMCSGSILDAKSQRRLARVMQIVQPLITGA